MMLGYTIIAVPTGIVSSELTKSRRKKTAPKPDEIIEKEKEIISKETEILEKTKVIGEKNRILTKKIN